MSGIAENKRKSRRRKPFFEENQGKSPENVDIPENSQVSEKPPEVDPPSAPVEPAQAFDLHAATVSTTELAAVFLLGETRVRQLAQQGYLPKITKGVFPLLPAVQGYIKFLRAEDRQSSKTAADSRVKDARASLFELQAAERRRDLIPVEEAKEVMGELVSFLADALAGISLRATRDLELRRAIEVEVNGARERIANQMAALARTLRTGKPDNQADALQ